MPAVVTMVVLPAVVALAVLVTAMAVMWAAYRLRSLGRRNSSSSPPHQAWKWRLRLWRGMKEGAREEEE